MNAAIGDKKIELGGRTFVLHPSFEAFAELEALLPGAGVARLYVRSLEIATDKAAGLGLKETVAVLYACAKLGGNRDLPDFTGFGRLVMADGYRKHAFLCYQLLDVAFPPADRVEETEKKTEVTSPTTATPGESRTASTSPGTAST